MGEQLGNIFNIQKFSFHDGTGVRTIVFFKGCSLRCKWCANPESQRLNTDIFYKKSNCIHCGCCAAACVQDALRMNGMSMPVRNETVCIHCNRCIQVCPTGAMECVGKMYTVDEIMKEVHRDAAFYRRSGGGVTLSGGEPLLQIDFAEALMQRLHAKGTDVVVETCGQVPEEAVDRVLPYVSRFLFDVKHTDTCKHRRATGAGNGQILRNLRRICEKGGSVTIRVPVIPKFNDDQQSIGSICMLAKELKVKELHLLPYHDFARTKYGYLNRDYPMGDIKRMTIEDLIPLAEYAAGFGLYVQRGG